MMNSDTLCNYSTTFFSSEKATGISNYWDGKVLRMSDNFINVGFLLFALSFQLTALLLGDSQ